MFCKYFVFVCSFVLALFKGLQHSNRNAIISGKSPKTFVQRLTYTPLGGRDTFLIVQTGNENTLDSAKKHCAMSIFTNENLRIY